MSNVKMALGTQCSTSQVRPKYWRRRRTTADGPPYFVLKPANGEVIGKTKSPVAEVKGLLRPLMTNAVKERNRKPEHQQS